MNFDALRYRSGCLELLDQRRLPGNIEYLKLRSAEEVAKAIREMAVRGAPAIGCAAAFGIAVEAMRTRHREGFRGEMEKASEMLSKSRPTAVNLFWALERMRRILDQGGEQDEVAMLLEKEAESIFEQDIRDNLKMGENGSALVPEKCNILTYCNAGALATAGHGTALGVIRSAASRGKAISVVACETRPFLQGARLTAWELEMESIPATLICDNMAGYLMKKGEIDLVIVGADRVAANGDVANKIGTYTLAVLARRHDIPFHVACPTSTIDPDTPNGEAIPIEERNGSEVRGYNGIEWAATGISVRNPAFDVTPSELVTSLITEKGVIMFPDDKKISALLAS